MGDATEPRLINTGRAARLLGVTSQTVRRWIDEGVLTAVRSHTGRYLLDADDVERLRPRPDAR